MIPDTGHEWEAFIAYANEDKPIAQSLQNILQAVGHEIFLDKTHLQPGDSFVERLKEGQQRSLATIILVSKHSKRSAYVRDEIKHALYLKKKFGHLILPVILNDKIVDLPYGLGDIQALYLRRKTSLLETAQRIKSVLDALLEMGQWKYEIDARTVIIVTGCNHLAELLDRPCAYKLKKAIETHAQGKAFLTAIVIGDLWYFQHKGYEDHPLLIAIGSGSSNGLTNSIAAGGKEIEASAAEDLPWKIDRNGDRWALYGGRAEGTQAATDAFIEFHLGDYLREAWV